MFPDALGLVDIHVNQVVVAGIAVAGKGELQVALGIARRVTDQQVVGRNALVQRLGHLVKERILLCLFQQRGGRLGKQAVLFQPDHRAQLVED